MDDQSLEDRIGRGGKREWTKSQHSRNRTLALGDNPNEQPKILRTQFEERFHVSVSSKRSVRTSQQLGSCHAIPRSDYVHYHYVYLPHTTEFDAMRKACIKTAEGCQLQRFGVVVIDSRASVKPTCEHKLPLQSCVSPLTLIRSWIIARDITSRSSYDHSHHRGRQRHD